MPLPGTLAPLGSFRWSGPPRFTLAPDHWGVDNSATTGLTYGYLGGPAMTTAGISSIVAAGTVALTDNATNYVDRSSAGVVAVNTSGFVSSRIPMAVVTTVSGAITAFVDRRPRGPQLSPDDIAEYLAQVSFLGKGVYNVMDPTYGGGAKGIGTDDSAAIRLAIAAAALVNGTVYFPPGVYIVTEDGVNSWAINLPSNVRLIGAGKYLSIIKLKASQTSSFVRLFNATSQSNILLRSLTLDGNGANQNPSFEQLHAVFWNACTNVTVDDCLVQNTIGDGVYWFGGCIRPRVTNCEFNNIQRCGVHAQTFSDGIIDGCNFHDSPDNNHIKAELDNEGEGGNGLDIVCNTFDGSTLAFAVQMSGFSDTSLTQDITVVGNTFKNIAACVSAGRFTKGWTVQGNTADNCAQFFCTTSYNTAYGYTGRLGITISGNTVRGGSFSNVIEVSNATDVVIASNNVQGSANGIIAQHSDAVQIIGNNVHLSAAVTNASNIAIYRCKVASVRGGSLVSGGGTASAGVYVSDDTSFPSTLTTIDGITVSGAPAHALNFHDFGTTSGVISVGRVDAPDAVAFAIDYIPDTGDGFPWMGRFSFGGHRRTWGTVAPAAGTWAVGDRCDNTNPSEAGSSGSKYVVIGWICTGAGTPGTWLQMRTLTGN